MIADEDFTSAWSSGILINGALILQLMRWNNEFENLIDSNKYDWIIVIHQEWLNYEMLFPE